MAVDEREECMAASGCSYLVLLELLLDADHGAEVDDLGGVLLIFLLFLVATRRRLAALAVDGRRRVAAVLRGHRCFLGLLLRLRAGGDVDLGAGDGLHRRRHRRTHAPGTASSRGSHAVASASQEGPGTSRERRGKKWEEAWQRRQRKEGRRGEASTDTKSAAKGARAEHTHRKRDVERGEGGGHVEADSDRGKGPRRKAPKGGGAVPRARARRGAERTPDGEGRWLDPTIGDGSASGREDNGGFNSPPAEPQGRRGDGVETT